MGRRKRKRENTSMKVEMRDKHISLPEPYKISLRILERYIMRGVRDRKKPEFDHKGVPKKKSPDKFLRYPEQ